MPRPLKITGIDHLLLKVDGMAPALAFYEGVLGCDIKSTLPQFGMAELSAGGHGLDLVDVAAEEGAWARPASGADAGNLHHLCLAIEAPSEPELRAHLAEHQVPIVEERLEDGYLSLYVLDPSANQVELRFRPAC
jgi:glyoxylase I family protein